MYVHISNRHHVSSRYTKHYVKVLLHYPGFSHRKARLIQTFSYLKKKLFPLIEGLLLKKYIINLAVTDFRMHKSVSNFHRNQPKVWKILRARDIFIRNYLVPLKGIK